jgi:hypothetical protein
MDIRTRPNPALNRLVRSQAVGWHPLDEPGVTGVDVKVLRFDEATNRAPTILLRFAADARPVGICSGSRSNGTLPRTVGNPCCGIVRPTRAR